MISLLLEQPNINVNVQSVYNYTALNLACMAGKTEVVKQLPAAGPKHQPQHPKRLWSLAVDGGVRQQPQELRQGAA